MGFNIANTDKKRVVIVGGGFAGLKLADNIKNDGFQVVLIDKNNYHQFPPLLYQVASFGLESSSISFPFRKIFQFRKDFHFRLAEVKGVMTDKNMIETTLGELSYDYLILAAGTETNFFGNENIKKVALPMKSIEEALVLRNALLERMEKAITCDNEAERQALMNIVVVGGGTTGVEISGALAEMKRFVTKKDYPELIHSIMNIYLVEGSHKLLNAMSENSSAKAEEFLTKMGIKILLNKKVVDYKDGHVILDDGKTIPTETLIWVSGVIAIRFHKLNPNSLGRGNRIIVNEYNQMIGHDNVFAIGDICLQTETAHPHGHPQVAQVAIQQGRLLAKNLRNITCEKPMEPFHYTDLGSLATVGRNRAVADIRKFKLQGFIAWLVWLIVHLRSILGVRNKLFVLIDWIWDYFTYDRSVRFLLYISKPFHK